MEWPLVSWLLFLEFLASALAAAEHDMHDNNREQKQRQMKNKKNTKLFVCLFVCVVAVLQCFDFVLFFTLFLFVFFFCFKYYDAFIFIHLLSFVFVASTNCMFKWFLRSFGRRVVFKIPLNCHRNSEPPLKFRLRWPNCSVVADQKLCEFVWEREANKKTKSTILVVHAHFPLHSVQYVVVAVTTMNGNDDGDGRWTKKNTNNHQTASSTLKQQQNKKLKSLSPNQQKKFCPFNQVFSREITNLLRLFLASLSFFSCAVYFKQSTQHTASMFLRYDELSTQQHKYKHNYY